VSGIGAARVVFFEDVGRTMHPVLRLMRTVVRQRLEQSEALRVSVVPDPAGVWSDAYSTIVADEVPPFVMTLGVEEAQMAASIGIISAAGALSMCGLALRTVTDDQAGVVLFRGEAKTCDGTGRLSLVQGRLCSKFGNPATTAEARGAGALKSAGMRQMRDVVAAASADHEAVPAPVDEAAAAVAGALAAVGDSPAVAQAECGRHLTHAMGEVAERAAADAVASAAAADAARAGAADKASNTAAAARAADAAEASALCLAVLAAASDAIGAAPAAPGEAPGGEPGAAATAAGEAAERAVVAAAIAAAASTAALPDPDAVASAFREDSYGGISSPEARLAASGLPVAIEAADFDTLADAQYFAAVGAAIRLVLDDPREMGGDANLPTLCRATLLAAAVIRSVPLQDRTFDRATMDRLAAEVPAWESAPAFVAELSCRLDTVLQGCAWGPELVDVLDGRLLAAVLVLLSDTATPAAAVSDGAPDAAACASGVSALLRGASASAPSTRHALRSAARATVQGQRASAGPLVGLVAQARAFAACGAAWAWLNITAGLAIPQAPWPGLRAEDGSAGPCDELAEAAEAALSAVPTLPRPAGAMPQALLLDRFGAAGKLVVDKTGRSSDPWPIDDLPTAPLSELLVSTLAEDDPYASDHFLSADALMEGYPLAPEDAPTTAGHSEAAPGPTAATRDGVIHGGVFIPRVTVPWRKPWSLMTPLQQFWAKRTRKARDEATFAVIAGRSSGKTAAQVAALRKNTRAYRSAITKMTAEDLQKATEADANRCRQIQYRSIQRSAMSQSYMGIPTVTVTEGSTRAQFRGLLRPGDRSKPILVIGAVIRVESAVKTLTQDLDDSYAKLGSTGHTSAPRALGELPAGNCPEQVTEWINHARLRSRPNLDRDVRAALHEDVIPHLSPELVEKARSIFRRRRQHSLQLDAMRLRLAHQAMLTYGDEASREEALASKRDLAGAGPLSGDIAAWLASTPGRSGEAVRPEDDTGAKIALGDAFQAAVCVLSSYTPEELAKSRWCVEEAVRCLGDIGLGIAAAKVIEAKAASVVEAAAAGPDEAQEAARRTVSALQAALEDAREAARATTAAKEKSVLRLTGRSVRAANRAALAFAKGDRTACDPISPELFQLTSAAASLARTVGKDDKRLPFKPDLWQVKLLDAVDARRSCIVSAPTSAGKTFICYYALEQVLREGDGLVMYVAPTDELTYQSRTDVHVRYHKDYGAKRGWQVKGMMTRRARESVEKCQLLAMTSDCARAALESASGGTLRRRLRWIILDEVHTLLDDPEMEKALIAADCPLLALSATIGEADRFAAWLGSLERRRGRALEMVTVTERWNDLSTFLFEPAPVVTKGAAMDARADGARKGAVSDGESPAAAVAAAAASSSSAAAPPTPSAEDDAAAAASSSSAAAPPAPSAEDDAAASGAGGPDDGDDGGDDDDNDSSFLGRIELTTGSEGIMLARADAQGTMHALHPVATLSADGLARHGVPSSTSLVPEDAVALHGAMSAAIGETLSSGMAAASEAAEELRGVSAELAGPMHPERFGWKNRMKITMREARSFGRKLLRRLARVADADESTAQAVIEALAPRARLSGADDDASGDVLAHSDGVLAACGAEETVAANLLGLTMTMRERGMLPALGFRLDEDSCKPLARRLCWELDELEHAYRSSAWFVARLNAAKTEREGLEAEIKRLRAEIARKRSPDDSEQDAKAAGHETEAALRHAEERLASLPSLQGVMRQFTLAGSTGRGVPTLSELKELPAFAKLTAQDVTYDPAKPWNNLFARALLRGIGLHTGLVRRRHRRVVEVLLREKKLSLVVCSATLALGIHMPCRSVVFLGDSPGLNSMTYRQMAGRAGRRGYDNRGNVVFLGVPGAKACRLVTSVAPRLHGTSPLDMSATARLAMRYGTSGLDIPRLGRTAAPVGLRESKAKGIQAIYPGGPKVNALGADATAAEVRATVEAAARAAECGMVLQDTGAGTGGTARPGMLVRPAQRDLYLRHDGPDSDEEGAVSARTTTVVGSAGAQAAAAPGPTAPAAASTASAGAAAGTGAAPAAAPSPEGAGATAAGMAPPAAPLQSGRLALAVSFEQLRRVGAITAEGKPTGLGGLMASFGRLGPGGVILAGVIASGALSRAWIRPGADAASPPSLAEPDEVQSVLRYFLRHRPSAGSAPARAVLPEAVVEYVERWNAMALGGFARYLRAESLAGEDGLPDAAVLPLTGVRAGRVERRFVEPDMTAVEVAGLRGEEALRAAVTEAEEAAAKAVAEAAEPGEAPPSAAPEPWADEPPGPAAPLAATASRRAPSGGWRAASGASNGPAADSDDDWTAGLDEPLTPAPEGAPMRRGASAAKIARNAATPVDGVSGGSLLAALRSAAIAPMARAPCSAVVGMGDEFGSEEDLLLNARPGLHPEVVALSVMDLDGPGVVSAAPEATPYALAEGYASDLRHIALVLADAEHAAVAAFAAATADERKAPGREAAVVEIRQLAFVVRRAAQAVVSDFQTHGPASRMWAKKPARDA